MQGECRLPAAFKMQVQTFGRAFSSAIECAFALCVLWYVEQCWPRPHPHQQPEPPYIRAILDIVCSVSPGSPSHWHTLHELLCRCAPRLAQNIMRSSPCVAKSSQGQPCQAEQIASRSSRSVTRASQVKSSQSKRSRLQRGAGHPSPKSSQVKSSQALSNLQPWPKASPSLRHLSSRSAAAFYTDSLPPLDGLVLLR